jgi:L-fucose mutarotase
MLLQRLSHPVLLGALAAAGHGSQVLLADGNYPHSTGKGAAATLVHLNLRPGLVTVDDVLELLVEVIPIESAAVMVPPPGGATPQAHLSYRRLLGDGIQLRELQRFDFYSAARTQEVALVVATGDVRHYANILLTVGARPDPDDT